MAEIGVAIRERLKARGEIAQAEKVWQAINQTGQTYDLALSVGDRVRLFRKTWGTVNGEAKQVGNNGNVVTIVAELNDGLRIRTQDGEVADVKWQKLMDDKTKRLFLGHGHAITIDAAQGITSDEHIKRHAAWDVVRDGVQGIRGRKSRQRCDVDRDFGGSSLRGRTTSASPWRQHDDYQRGPLEASRRGPVQ